MSTFQVVSMVVCLVAVFGYLNHRFVRLPDAIGITAIGVVVSIGAVVLARFDAAVATEMRLAVARIDFPAVLLHGVLGLLLFAGSLHIDIRDVAKEKWLILSLATFGVVASTALVGAGFFAVTRAMGMAIPWLYCLLLGVLISPTDPIAVLAVLKRVGVPTSLETRIAGESLFNDGTAVAVFLTLLALAGGDAEVSVGSTALLFATEVFGGALFGIAAGYLGYFMLRGVDSYPVEILITLALANAGYAAAEKLAVSAPIAVVLMGLIVGNRGRKDAMSDETLKRLFGFWEVLDELMNLVLFGFIGLEMMTLTFSVDQAVVAAAGIVIVLVARLVSVGAPILVTPRLRELRHAAIAIMTWGGLRGGISIALALSLPEFVGRSVLISTAYAVVIFSILVQATSLHRVIKAVLPAKAGIENPASPGV
jgi:CPA1 family monovalent cation:H+ antiporter